MLKPEYFVNGILIAITLLIVGKIIFKERRNLNNKKIILGIVISSIVVILVNIYNESLISNLLRIMILFLTFSTFYRIVYNKDISISIMAGFITYLLYFLAEIIVDIPLYIILSIIEINATEVRNAIIINLIISLVVIIMAKLMDVKIREIIKHGNIDRKIIVGISILILFTLSMLIFSTPVAKLKFDMNFLITMILLTLFCIIGFILIKQRVETQKITDKYAKLAKYSKNNEGLLEEYRMNLHENKNRLIRIDHMVPKEYTEIHEYIDELIEINRSNKYYWLTELKYVPSSELKGFMNYKIMEMINDKLDVEINVSRELKQRILKNYTVKDKEDLYSIVGIFLDNAHEAAKISKEKAVSIQMFMDGKNLKIIVANTYKGKINLAKINEYGYSSKGKNRGTGLHIVNEIVNRNQLFEKDTSILDNYFVQTLTIKYKNFNKKKV